MVLLPQEVPLEMLHLHRDRCLEEIQVTLVSMEAVVKAVKAIVAVAESKVVKVTTDVLAVAESAAVAFGQLLMVELAVVGR